MGSPNGGKLRSALTGTAENPPPLWLMRQAGRYLPEYRALRARAEGFLDFCYTPALAVEATLQPIRRFDLDAAIVFSDILVVADAMGLEVAFRDGEGPRVETVRDAAALGRLRPRPEVLSPVHEAVAEVRAALAADKALIGFAGGPWTVAYYILEGRGGSDGDAALSLNAADPVFIDRLVAGIEAVTVDHLSRQIAAGADAVQIFDSWAGILDAAGFRRRVIEPTARITRELRRRHPGTPVIGFPRGAGTGYEAYAVAAGVDAVGIDSAVAPEWAAARLQGRVAVQGNLDNRLLRAGGPGLDAAVDDLCRTLGGGGGFVFNLGHGVLPDTPVENVARLVERVRAGAGAREG